MQTTFKTIPIAGSIKHGAKQGKEGKERPVELGYFVAQVHDNAMEHLAEKFNNLYKESKELNIYFQMKPIFRKRVRNNQGGTVCYCLLDQTKGKEKMASNGLKKTARKNANIGQLQKVKNQHVLLKVHLNL